MAILKYLGIVFYAARAARAETERTPLVPLVSIRELHEDFSGKVEDAKCDIDAARRRCLGTRRRASASKVLRTTGGARSATRTTTVLPILMTNAGTRTGESNPRTSRYRSLRGPIPSPPPLSSPPHIW